ncbi:hypothetical protein Trydic_g20319 [Trypoxylus dichotomus]
MNISHHFIIFPPPFPPAKNELFVRDTLPPLPHRDTLSPLLFVGGKEFSAALYGSTSGTYSVVIATFVARIATVPLPVCRGSLIDCTGFSARAGSGYFAHPFMDEEGIIRVGGRLKRLPAKHPLTRLIILNGHYKQLYTGTQETIVAIRTKCWQFPLRTINLVIPAGCNCWRSEISQRIDGRNWQLSMLKILIVIL